MMKVENVASKLGEDIRALRDDELTAAKLEMRALTADELGMVSGGTLIDLRVVIACMCSLLDNCGGGADAISGASKVVPN